MDVTLTVEQLRALASYASNPRWSVNLPTSGPERYYRCVEFDVNGRRVSAVEIPPMLFDLLQQK